MRKIRRHSPTWFENAEKRGRGLGTYKDYTPLHANTRFDPSSRGRGHCVAWRERIVQLLSDKELIAFLFSTQISGIDDIREQFPLQFRSAHHELKDYRIDFPQGLYPGTEDICEELGIRHPRSNEKGRSGKWWMSTDQLLTFKNPFKKHFMVATAVKLSQDIIHERTQQLLRVEQRYWWYRKVQWLLFTPDLYDERVALTLLGTRYWGLSEPLNIKILDLVQEISNFNIGRPLTFLLQNLALELGSMDLAQCAFWQNVWQGNFPLDLRRGWRPHLPIEILSIEAFHQLNPIRSGRSAWI